jgi:hypothetical protein
MNQYITYLPISGIIIIYGLHILITRRAKIGLGPSSSNLGKILLENPTIINIVGISMVFGGILVIIPFVLSIFNNGSDYAGLFPFLGILISITGMVFGSILQVAINFGKWLGEKREDER